MSQKKILMLVGDYGEDYETMVPFQILTMVGHHVDAVCPDKKPGDSIKTAVHDFIGDQTYVELPGHRFAINFDFSKVDPASYDALVLPGGRAPEYLRLNPRVVEIARHFVETNKPIAAVCHGPQILVAANGIKGKKVAPYPAVGPECTAAGAAEVIGPNETFSNAITDGNLVSAPAWPAHPEWMKQFLKLLGSKIEA